MQPKFIDACNLINDIYKAHAHSY